MPFYILSLILIFFQLIVWQMDSFAGDPGLGWHLENGLLILESGRIPWRDPFLAPARDWIADQWLADVIIAAAYQLGEWPLLYALMIAAYLKIFFLLCTIAAVRSQVPIWAVSIAAFISAKIGLVHFLIRPVLFGYLLFAFTFFWFREICSSSKTSSESAANRGKFAVLHAVLLPLTFALWANLHPSFVVGLAAMGLLLMLQSADKILLKREVSARDIRFGILIIVLCSAATLLNPYGLELHRSILELGSSEFFMNLNEEWRSLDFKEGAGPLLLLSVGIIIAAARLEPRFAQRLTLAELGLLFVFFCLSAGTVRFLPFFVIVSMPILADSFRTLWQFGKRFLSGKVEDSCHGGSHQEKIVSGVFSVVSVSLLIFSWAAERIPFYEGPYGPSQTKYPYDAVRFLEESSSSQSIVYSSPNWGGFITLQSFPRLQAVLDDRNTLLGEEPYRDFFSVSKGEAGWQRVLQDSGAHYLLLPVENLLSRLLLQKNEPYYQDDQAAIFKVEEILGTTITLGRAGQSPPSL